MISLNESIKRARLEYAWEVVTDASHRVDCEKLGENVFDLDATETRWPGYIGTNYSSGNPIFVSNIHRNFDSGGLTEDVSIVRDFSSANENWKSALLGSCLAPAFFDQCSVSPLFCPPGLD